MLRRAQEASERFPLLRHWAIDLVAIAAITALITGALISSIRTTTETIRWVSLLPLLLPKDPQVSQVHAAENPSSTSQVGPGGHHMMLCPDRMDALAARASQAFSTP